MSVPQFSRWAGLLCALGLSVAAQGASLPSGFAETRVPIGFWNATTMAMAPDGRLFIAEQTGSLRIVKNGTLLAQPFVTISVNSSGERGLLGVAFDPNFATNNFVYVYYTTSAAPIHNRVSRFTASAANPDVAAAGSEIQLLDLPTLSSATNHNGGAIHFGTDGMLYIAVGENANSANSQSFTTTLGKMLRINPDGSIPSDNPFLSQTTGINQAIWARGLRNPFTFAFDSTGRMHINDVGEGVWEEVNLGVAGSNYGWPQTEGNSPSGVAGVRYPIHTYSHDGSGGCAITGGAFYPPTSANFPAAYAGRYFFGDYCGGFIKVLSPPDYTTSASFATGVPAPTDIQVHPDGSLYYLARDDGAVFRVQYTASTAPSISSNPTNVTVAAGQSASFTVAASGSPPLQYQWQRNGVNISNAMSPTYTFTTTAADNGATFRAVVSNSAGSATSSSAVLTVLSNGAPTGTITAPTSTTTYRGGETFTFTGTGTDPEDGPLPASAFTWQVDFHHDEHTHPFMAATSGIATGTFTIANRGETAANVFYRVILTVRDSSGLTHTSSVDIQPLTTVVSIESNVTGAQLTLDGIPITAPYTFTGVEGVIRTLGVVTPQTSGGTTYDFVSWSDGGQATHEIVTPTDDTTLTALFQPATVATLFSDDFETAKGWALTPNGNQATTGRWQRGDPQPTTSGGITLQPGTCAGPSVNCFVTGLMAGSAVGAKDVDGGQTSIQSPSIALPAGSTITLRFQNFFAHQSNATSADYFRVRVVGSNGAAQTVYSLAGKAQTVGGVWTAQTVDLSAYAGQTIRLRFEAADAATGSTIEAGFDNVVVTRQ